jgi:hypothetical protein
MQKKEKRWAKITGALLTRVNWPVRLADPPAVELCVWKPQFSVNLEKVKVMSMEMRIQEGGESVYKVVPGQQTFVEEGRLESSGPNRDIHQPMPSVRHHQASKT